MTDADAVRNNESSDPGGLLGTIGIFSLGIYLHAVMAALVYLLVALWPEGASVHLSVFCRSLAVLSRDQALLWSMAVLGAIGGNLHAISSFVAYVGNRTFVRSWVWWYVARAPVGISLALVMYFVLRGGLFPLAVPTSNPAPTPTVATSPGAPVVAPAASAPASPAAQGTPAPSASPRATPSPATPPVDSRNDVPRDPFNAYGMGALAALCGLCSEIATQKLREIFMAAFRPAETRRDPVGGTPPHLRAIEPVSVTAGVEATDVKLTGSDFRPGDSVLVDGVAVPTRIVSPSALQATLPKTKLAVAGTLQLSVRRNDAQPLISEVLSFEVKKPTL